MESNIKQIIIDRANDICKNAFMDYPDYDKDNPIEDLATALTVIITDVLPHDTEIDSVEVFDYFDKNII